MPIKKTKEDYIEEAQKKHNYKYDYSQIIELPKRDFRVNIICQQHGIFEQSFHKHLSGDGCKKCAFEKIGKDKIEKAKNKFINDVTIKHNNKYNYSKLNYISAKEKIIITCPIHGDFEQTPNSHLNGNGCGKCANEKTKERMSIPWNIYKEDLQKIHNNKYNYSKVIWKGVDTDIIVECPTHGEFEIRPANHKRERGCPKCSNQYSKISIEWLSYMEIKNSIKIINAKNEGEFNIPNTKYKADGYCKETNTIYEFHGDFWHGNPNKYLSTDINKKTGKTFGELYQNTLNKEQRIRDMRFNLITIWESDWIKLNKCVKLLQRKFRISKMY